MSDEYRQTARMLLRSMSDRALAFQDALAVGGPDREELDRELARRAGSTTDAPEGAGKEATVATETTIPTAESLMEGIGEAVAPGKAPYWRLRIVDRKPNTSSEGPDDFTSRTLAYASARKKGVLLDFAASAVEGAPARFQKALEVKGSRATLLVTASNAKGARTLLEWLAKQV